MEYMACLWSFFACAAFGLIYNMRGKTLMLASLGGALGWFVYLLLNFVHNDIFQFFIATVATAIYSEIMARILKKPATEFQIVALLPMVPGGGIFYTMDYCVIGNNQMFLQTGLHTLGIAGALAMGILLVSSLFRIGSRPESVNSAVACGSKRHFFH